MNDMSERMCIVTREKLASDQLIRFVLSPSGELVPDIKQNLPGRGCWITAKSSYIDKALKKGLFSRALKQKIEVPENLAEIVDQLLVKSSLGMINMARKAGQFITGSAKVDHAIRAGEALASLHATDAANDGVRKINQARTFFSKMFEEEKIPSFQLFSSQDMAKAIGEGNYIHCAILAGKAGESVLKRIKALAEYRELPVEQK